MNRYAYVVNNPLRYTDPTGEIAPLVILGIVLLAGAIGGGVSTGYYMATTPQDQWSFEAGATAFGAGFAGGAAFAGLTIATGGGFASFVAAGALSGAVGYGTERGIEYGFTRSLEWDWADLGTSVAFGAAVGVATYGAGRLYLRLRFGSMEFSHVQIPPSKFTKLGHGRDMGFASVGEWEAAAKRFIEQGLRNGGRGSWRVFASRGDLVVVDQATNRVAIYNPARNVWKTFYTETIEGYIVQQIQTGAWRPIVTWYSYFW